MMNENLRPLFLRMQLTVFCYAFVYAFLFMAAGAWGTAALFGFVLLIVSPLTYLLERLGWEVTARFSFLLSALTYIASVPMGRAGESMRADFYYLPAMMIPLLIFKPSQWRTILIGAALPMVVWGASRVANPFANTPGWVIDSALIEWFHLTNFIGAFFIVGVFLVLHGRHLAKLKADSLFQLAQNNTRMEYVLDAAGLGTWDWWVETNECVFDARWFEMLGLDPKTTPHVYATWEDRIHPDDKGPLLTALKAHLEGKSPLLNCVVRLQHANGHWIWVMDRGRVSERGADGKPLRMTGTHYEITRTTELETLSQDVQRIGKIGGWELDVATQQTKWTEQTYRIHEIDPSISTDVTMGLTFFPPEDQAKVSNCVRRAIEHAEPFDGFFEFISAKGNRRWVRSTGEPVQDSRGKVYALRGTFQDVTAQRLAEQALRAAQGEIDLFFSVSIDLLCVAGTDGYFKRVNPAFESVLGYTSEELQRRPMVDFVHPDDRLKTEKELQRLASGVPTLSFENRYLSKDGTYKVLSWLTAPPDPATGLMCASARDITSLRKAEAELRQIFSALHESAIVAITDTKGRILEANDNFCQISEYARTELVGNDHRIINSGKHPKEFFREMWRVIQQGHVWRGEICNRSKSGREYWVQTVIAPLRDHMGTVDRFLSIRLDITDQKKAEFKLVQSAKMASLGEMAGGIAHEINNPLAIIQAKVGQLRREAHQIPVDPQAIEQGLSKIESTVERVAKIVKGLRSFSRSSEKDPMVSTPVKSIVEDTLELCRERMNVGNVALKVSGALQGEVECRPSQISQVLLNLLSNAIDAIEPLPEKWIDLKLEFLNDKWRVTVVNSGPPIPPELVNKIMQPFFTTKPVGKGTGLGLSIAKAITEDHKGTLFYDSTAPHPTFTFELPKAQQS
jgi:PAS domain S-box-containing protein